jgi:N-carbamoylputrescine amidase
MNTENENYNLVKAAAVQFEPKIGETASNQEKLLSLIKKAFDQGAHLVVAPEMANTGYMFESKEEAYQLAELVPGGPMVQALENTAAEHEGYIVSGMMEREGDKLYNTAVLVGPEGFIGKYRKTHLWDVDKSIYEPGDIGFPVFDLPFARIGICICYDQMFPEVSRIFAMQDVDIICSPTNWVVIPGLATPEDPTWAYNVRAQSQCSSIYMVCADRIGNERGVTFGGSSCITGLMGFLGGPASGDKEEIITADLDIAGGRVKMLSAVNHLLNDRRTDLYDEKLGYKG